MKRSPWLPALGLMLVAAAPARAGSVSGSGLVGGVGTIACPEETPSTRSGSLMLAGTIEVRDSDGARGTAHVTGTASLSGSCSFGSGMLSGLATVSGLATIYGKDGRRLGSAHVSGTVHVTAFGSSFVGTSQSVTVSGSY